MFLSPTLACLAASAALWAVVHRAVALWTLRDVFDGHYDSSLLWGHSFGSDIFYIFLELFSKSCLDRSGKDFLEK